MTTPPPYPGQDPDAGRPYPGQDPTAPPPFAAEQQYGQPPYAGQQPYGGQPPYAEPPSYGGQPPAAGQPSYPAPDPGAQQAYPPPGAYPQQPYQAQDPYAQQPYAQDPYQAQDPYAQQPYAGQQYQQPGFAVPGAGEPPMPGMAPAEPRKKSQRWIGILVAVLVVAGFGTYRFIQSQSSPAKASVGDCINYSSESDVSIVKCDSDKAQYRVETRIDSSLPTACNSIDDSDVQLYSKDEGSSEQFSLCVSLVLKEGSCVSQDGDVTACDAEDAMARVTSIHEGSSDPSVCAEDEYARPYTLRPRVVCLADVS